jgi:hypothetical protein
MVLIGHIICFRSLSWCLRVVKLFEGDRLINPPGCNKFDKDFLLRLEVCTYAETIISSANYLTS